ncbi:unnamed protein product [Rhizophagus irregularis]|nr:unnamed protein product [Rhizophagus irregularis]
MEAIYKSAMEEGLDCAVPTNSTPLQQSDDILDGVKLYFDTMDQMDLEKQTPTPTPTTSSSINRKSDLNEDFSKRLPLRPLVRPLVSTKPKKDNLVRSDDSDEEKDNKKKRKLNHVVM